MAKLPQELRTMYTDAFAYHEKFHEMGNTPEEWEKAVQTAKDVAAHHNNHPLIIALLGAAFDWLDEERNAEKWKSR